MREWWRRHIAWRLLSSRAHDHAFIPRASFNAKTKRHHDKSRAIAKAEGMCGTCWKRRPTEGYKTCEICRTRAREIGRDRRRAAGVPVRAQEADMAPRP